jgi:uncharacterized protein involved in exopolysaccharide biosynthesis
MSFDSRALNVVLAGIAGALLAAAFAAYRLPAMAFFLDGFRLCG